MPDRVLASFRIDITSVREHTWQGRVKCGKESCDFESELEMLRCMMKFAPGLAPDLRWPAHDFQEQEDVT